MSEKDQPISAADWEQALRDGDKPAAGSDAPTASGGSPSSAPTSGADMAHVFETLQSGGAVGAGGGMELVAEIPITLSVELGRMKMPVKSLVQLGAGSVVELEGRAGEPLNIYANGVVVAKGEVVVVNDRFGIRLTELVPGGRPKKEI